MRGWQPHQTPQRSLPDCRCGILVHRRSVVPLALHFLTNGSDFCIAPQYGLTIGPGKRRRNLAGISHYWASRRLITQIRPLKIEGVSALDRDARHHVGSRAAEGALRTLV